MQIVFGLLFLLFFSACCLCVAACTRFDAALPALCGSAVVLYLLSLLGLLQFGHFIIMAVWLAGGVYFGVRAGWRAIRRALFSPGFLLFVGGSCFLWVLFALQQPMFTQWDEFTAWGLAPKMVAERAALYVADPINLTASFTYPATSLVSYLFQRVPGQFYEWQCLAGLVRGARKVAIEFHSYSKTAGFTHQVQVRCPGGKAGPQHQNKNHHRPGGCR